MTSELPSCPPAPLFGQGHLRYLGCVSVPHCVAAPCLSPAPSMGTPWVLPWLLPCPGLPLPWVYLRTDLCNASPDPDSHHGELCAAAGQGRMGLWLQALPGSRSVRHLVEAEAVCARREGVVESCAGAPFWSRLLCSSTGPPPLCMPGSQPLCKGAVPLLLGLPSELGGSEEYCGDP